MRVLGADDDREVARESRAGETVVNVLARGHADDAERVSARESLDEGDDARKDWQLVLDERAVLRRLALDDAAQRVVRQLAPRALEGRAHERHVVHAERLEVILSCQLDALVG